MDESILRAAGHRLYVTSRLKEMKRYLVFRARCRMHKDIIEDVLDFFATTELRKKILEGTPSFIEQVTRAFFYKGSHYPDRSALVKNHILFMEKHFTPESIAKLYAEADENTNSGKRLTLWEDVFEDRLMGRCIRRQTAAHEPVVLCRTAQGRLPLFSLNMGRKRFIPDHVLVRPRHGKNRRRYLDRRHAGDA